MTFEHVFDVRAVAMSEACTHTRVTYYRPATSQPRGRPGSPRGVPVR